MIIAKLDFPWSENEDMGRSQISFEPDCNLIVGCNGCGKTTCVNALHRNLTNHLPTIQIEGDGILDDFILQLMFVGHEVSQFFETFPNLEREYLRRGGALDLLELALSEYVNDIMTEKITPRRNLKFSEIKQFEVVLNDDLTLEILNKASGESCLNSGFMAMGEQVALSLAVNLSIRKLLDINIPFIWDDAFDRTDSALTEGIFRVLNKQEFQKILFLSVNVSRQLNDLNGLCPTHKIMAPWVDI